MIRRLFSHRVPAAGRIRRTLGVALALGLFGVAPVRAQEKPADEAAKAHVIVKLVTDFESGKLVSDLEEFQEITSTVFDASGSREELLGERCVLWVRNAHVDGKFFFERFYQGKYIGRSAQLEIEREQLAPGEHRIQPGDHMFTLSAEGQIASADPSIRIAGNTLLVQMHKVTLHAVDAAQRGPEEFRLVAANLGLLSTDAALRIDPEHLPDPAATFDPQSPPEPGRPIPPLTNVLSHQKAFYPLSVWLPANQVGQGYVLYPSWQAFHLRSDGQIDLEGPQAPRVAGIEAHDATIVIPYRAFRGRINSLTGLAAGVGNVPLTKKMNFGATLSPSHFVGSHDKPGADFYLLVDSDFSQQPYKYFLADNSTADKEAIRLLALEWSEPVYQRGTQATIRFRLLETPGKELKNPQARMSYSLYRPANPAWRDWQPLVVSGWKNGRDAGELRFQIPDRALGYALFRAEVIEADDPTRSTSLFGEIEGCVIDPHQTGTASFVSNRGRTAFIAGEDIDLQLVLRSEKDRPAADRTIVLVHPDGEEETLSFKDPGQAWVAQSLRLPSARTATLLPGTYQLSIRNLPPGIAAVVFKLELCGRQKPSLFHVVKPSKYTQQMNELETSLLEGHPIDLDRAMQTLAELGYTRVDLMSYITNHHLRGATWREELAVGDARLPPPENAYAPTPREQILNACVRNQLQFSDVWLSYGDFHLPRYIESYIHASERWMAREIQAMRHSPALDGMILYDEMYQSAAVGFVPGHQKFFSSERARLVEAKLGQSPAKLEQDLNRYLQRPKNQRDPQTLNRYLAYQDWQQLGWADYVDRVVKVGKGLMPQARFGTYTRTWASPGSNDDLYHGYPPDLFKSLDIISHMHYADNSTAWVSTPMLAQILRTGQNKTLYVNMPLTHEARTNWDGQYQRMMAFALLAQGANGIAQWGLPHSFEDGPNPGTAIGRETTRRLNLDVLQPLGEIIDRTQDGYRQVGIVSTKNQHALSQLKQLPVANQSEAIWIACWRLGYPAVFLREDTLQQPLDDFAVLFVPGVRFQGELEEPVVKRLQDAIAAGKKVVVESDSALDIPGIIKLEDWALNSYFLGDNYFPTWEDDELNKVYEKSQPTVDYLGPKLKQWNVEPAASGPFKVGPGWRDGGAIDYLVMANFEDPDYSHTVRQQMARPVLMPLEVAAHHGRVAYDLLSQQELPLGAAAPESGTESVSVTLDMRQMQGALVAFLPERIGKLQARYSQSDKPGRLRLTAKLLGESGRALDAVFPVEIKLQSGRQSRVFHRVLGRDLTMELDLPESRRSGSHHVELRESISGRTLAFDIPYSAPTGPSLELPAGDRSYIPYPLEVRDFLRDARSVIIVPSKAIAGAPKAAELLRDRLKARGVAARIADEQDVYHYPAGDPKAEDPLGDGFHSWHSRQEVIGPATIVDEPVILLGGRHSLFLVDQLAEHGFLSVLPLGSPGLATRPSIQVASKGLHYAHDTLCLIANDSLGLEQNIAALLGDLHEPPAPPDVRYGADQVVESAQATAEPAATAGLGTNELVQDLQFDPAGNIYAITWGHGKNLISLKADGTERFSRHLPEMGVNRLSVHADRLYAYTSAGARLYQLSLDNQPRSQARLNMDPGDTMGCDSYSLSTVDFQYLPERRLLLHNMGDRMRLLDEQFQTVGQWQGEEYFDKDVADSVMRRALHSYVLSPDQQRIAQLETSSYFTKAGYEDRQVFDTHLVIRDLQGKLLHEHKDVANGFKIKARLSWPADAPGPVLYVPRSSPAAADRRWAFAADLQTLSDAQYDLGLYSLGGERRLIRDGRKLAYYDSIDRERCRCGPLETMPTVVELSPDGRFLAMLDEYGLLSLFGAEDGVLRKRFNVSELGQVLRFSPDSQQLLLGGYRGGVYAFDLDGKPLWQTRLGQFNELTGQALPLYDATFPDFTEKLWPSSHDQPGDLDALVRLGVNRLVNGDGEAADGWQGAEVAYHALGRESSRSLKVGQPFVGQEVTGFLGTHATWVFEFFYRSADDTAHPDLLAGLMTESDAPDSVAAHFQADSAWRFGRVVIKNGSNCRKLAVGFSAQTGEVLIDTATLRQIRFPSVNPMLSDPIYHLKPVVLENPLFSQKYDPVGNLRDQAPNRVLIPTLPGPLNLVESAYLQNGRLNDVGSHWYIQPFNRTSPHLPISLGMKDPRWISMVALYFNDYDAANVTPHFDIYAVDQDTGKDRLVASVRHNGQLFRLVKFPPIKTSLVKVDLVNSIARLRTLTEVELYGPLSGREGTPGFVDPDGQNTYMGDFTRVDKRTKTLAEKYLPPIVKPGGNTDDVSWAAPLAEILVSEDRFHVARAFGKNTAYALSEPTKELYWGRAGGLGYTPYGALYGGLLLRCGNDGKLYCLNPDTGTELWSAALGQRLFGCPVAIGEDVFVTDDANKLVQLDLASGAVMKETAISGTVYGSPACDGRHLFFITDDGFLHNYRASDLQPDWKMAVAPFTDSTPAVDQGVVYLADQQGRAVAVDVQTGTPRWAVDLKDEFCRCPVVAPDKIVYGCRGGTLVVLDRATGNTVWSKQADSRFDYEPLLLGDQVLFFRNARAMLARLADGAETPFTPPGLAPADGSPPLGFALAQDPIVPISFYKGRLFFIDRPGDNGHATFQVNAPWNVNGGSFTLLAPVPPPVPVETKP